MPQNFWQKPIETFQELLLRKAPHLRQIRHHFSPALGREMSLDVYLPPDYQLSPARRYPLVLFNDGQDLPTMHFSKILEKLYFTRSIPYCIAVGVYANEDRIREYGTARQADYKGRGDRAPQFRDFVVRELMPYLQQRFRLDDDPHARIYAGFSLGALSAFDIAWAHPRQFGVVGVFSGALWWRWETVHESDPDAARILHDIIHKAHGPNPGQRYWLQAGTLDEDEDRNHNGVIDAIDDTLDLIRELKRKGTHDVDVHYLEVEGGRHDTQTWGQVMPDFLRWALIRGNSDG